MLSGAMLFRLQDAHFVCVLGAFMVDTASFTRASLVLNAKR